MLCVNVTANSERLHWAASTPCHSPLPLPGCRVRAWRGEHLLLPRSTAALVHSALKAPACDALNTLSCIIASPQTHWCMLCAGAWAGPLPACSEHIWCIFPDTEAKVLWLNVLVLETRHHGGLILLLRKEMSRSGVCNWEE